jgi:hypothetical protein
LKYYVINSVEDPDKTIAVIMYDYEKSYFSVHTNSKVFQRVSNASEKLVRSSRYIKVKNVMRILKFPLSNPLWINKFLKQVLGTKTLWVLSDQGVVGSEGVLNIVNKYMSEPEL